MTEFAMVALVPSEPDLKRLAIRGHQPKDLIHLTLLFLGEAADYDLDTRDRISSTVAMYFESEQPVIAAAFGAAHWPNGEEAFWVLNVEDDRGEPDMLADFRDTAATALADADVTVPAQFTPWSPHICLAQTQDLGLLEEMCSRIGPITFDTLRVAFGDDVRDQPMKGDPS